MTNTKSQEWDAFFKKVQSRKRLMPDWRLGQTYFNTLAEVKPELADLVRGTIFDPFYDDRKLNDFMEFIFQRW